MCHPLCPPSVCINPAAIVGIRFSGRPGYRNLDDLIVVDFRRLVFREILHESSSPHLPGHHFSTWFCVYSDRPFFRDKHFRACFNSGGRLRHRFCPFLKFETCQELYSLIKLIEVDQYYHVNASLLHQ